MSHKHAPGRMRMIRVRFTRHTRNVAPQIGTCFMSQYNMPHTQDCTGSDLVNEEATVHCLLLRHQEHAIKRFESW